MQVVSWIGRSRAATMLVVALLAVGAIVVEGSPAGGYAAALQGPFAHAFSSADR